jgi:hypothetical protein
MRSISVPTESRRSLAIAASALILLLPVAFSLTVRQPLQQPFGVDYDLYRDVTARWLAGGPYFEARQLAGPYLILPGDVLYPPVALWLFVPFALLATPIAALLWWTVPLGVTIAALIRLRPRPEWWPLIVLCAVWPTTLLKIWTGNPVMWTMGALALATVTRWPAVFVLLKPSLAPFALFGARDRSWWMAFAMFVVLSLPFLHLWDDWVATVVNSRGGGLLYSVLEVPMLALPLVAYLGRDRSAREPDRPLYWGDPRLEPATVRGRYASWRRIIA